LEKEYDNRLRPLAEEMVNGALNEQINLSWRIPCAFGKLPRNTKAK